VVDGVFGLGEKLDDFDPVGVDRVLRVDGDELRLSENNALVEDLLEVPESFPAQVLDQHFEAVDDFDSVVGFLFRVAVVKQLDKRLEDVFWFYVHGLSLANTFK
jgi:hypothetical protein